MKFNIENWLENLCSRTFTEAELYELLVFDIESNFDFLRQSCMILYLERLPDGRVKIEEARQVKDQHELYRAGLASIEKREWLEISKGITQVVLVLVRLDRSGSISSIFRDHTITSPWWMRHNEECPPMGPMTEEDLRRGFQELAGIFEEEMKLQKSKKKMAV